MSKAHNIQDKRKPEAAPLWSVVSLFYLCRLPEIVCIQLHCTSHLYHYRLKDSISYLTAFLYSPKITGLSYLSNMVYTVLEHHFKPYPEDVAARQVSLHESTRLDREVY